MLFSLTLRKFKVSYILRFALLFVLSIVSLFSNSSGQFCATAQESASPSRPPEGKPQESQPQEPQAQVLPPAPVTSNYDKTIFLKPIPGDQLTFLSQFSGVAAKDVMRDKQFRKLMKSFIPDCMFHYGRDMMLSDAMDMVFKESTLQAQIRDGRYLTISGLKGPYLDGRAFLWIDMQDGIGMGGFYFHQIGRAHV